MNKYNKKIICMFVFAMIVFPSVIKAESFQYNLKAVVDGANSKIKDTAKYCYTYGCRSGNMGVKISIYNGNTLKTIESSEEVGKDASSNIRIAGVVSNIEDGFNDLATKINKQPTNTDTIEFNDFCNFLNQNDPVLGYGLIHTYQYRVLSSYWSKFRIEQNAINNCDLSSGKFDIKKDNFSRGVGEPPTHDNYIKYFERRNPYIVMEPMISITVSDKENQKASKAFSTFGIDALPDKIMERIKSVSNGKANANTDNISNFMAKTFCNFGGAEQTSCQAITDLYESATPQDLDKLASAWNIVVENFHTEGTKQTKTVKEWAKWIMTGTNYKYVGANSDGTLSSEASKLGGSVTSWIKDISWYFHLGENIGPFTGVSTRAASWKSIVGMTNGYGIIVLKVSINSYDDSKYKCRYFLKDNELEEPEGKEKKDCCEETDIWNDYDGKTGKSNMWQNFSKSDLYKEICPVEIEDNYCKWNGNKTERWQTINGKKLDCCIYSNYGENAKTVTGFKTEDDFKEYGWYKNNNCETDIDIEPPQYCTIQKLQNGDTSCCHQEGLNKWSPSFIKGMLENGYADTPAGLEEYLKYKIGVNKYNKLCGKNECTYEIESLCPSCDNEDTSYGLVMDTVGGSDSTALQLSKETEKCIFNNNDYLYQNNSYCKIYCTEKVEYSLPKRSTLSVTAGTRLVVGGNLSPVESKTTITCRRSEIDTKKFESDLKGKIDALKAAYDAYTEASVPLNENKIITHYDDGTHVSRSEWNCECKNNVGSGIVSNNICCESVSYEDSGLSHGRLVVSATYSSYDATPIINECYGGTWKTTDTSWSESNCGQSGASDPKTKGTHKNECKLTKPITPICIGGITKTIGYEDCGSGYTLSGSTCDPNPISGCSKSGGTVTCKTVSCDSSYGNGLTERKLVSTHSGYTTSLSNSMCSYAYCSKRNYDRYDFQTVDAYRYGYNKLLPKGAQGQICENESGYYQPKYESLKETRKKILLAAWNDYNSVINNLNMCYNFTDRVKSNYKININLSYQNGSYSIDTLLDSSVSQSSDKNFTQTVSTRGYRNCGTMTGVDFLNCEQETKYYTENIDGTYAAGTSTNTYTYTLPNNSSMYRYVNKSSLSEKDSNINSIYIGPHLPVAYNEKDNKIEVELTPSVVRTNTSGTIYITKTRNDFESEICTDPYKCDSVTPGKTKIVPVYRVIALDSPFPDEDGNGRLTGRNWCSGSDCSNTNAVVQKVITNNRGVKENEVYKLTPLYTLVLTPSTVKKIREYNSQTSYGDYNLICEKDTGKYCKSLYLRGEPDKEGNIIDNNLDQMGVLRRDKSCALNENLSGCMFGDYYERGA